MIVRIERRPPIIKQCLSLYVGRGSVNLVFDPVKVSLFMPPVGRSMLFFLLSLERTYKYKLFSVYLLI